MYQLLLQLARLIHNLRSHYDNLYQTCPIPLQKTIGLTNQTQQKNCASKRDVPPQVDGESMGPVGFLWLSWAT